MREPSVTTDCASASAHAPTARAVSTAATHSPTSPRAIEKTRRLSAPLRRPAASAMLRAQLFAELRASARHSASEISTA
jgi:hypothetical protein